MDFVAKEAVIKYQEQNREIIKHNIRLQERISMLESVIQEMRQDILHFRIKKVMTKNKKKKTTASSRKDKAIDTTRKENILKPKCNQTKDNKPPDMVSKTRRNTKSISYALPSTKSKLRKGDPFTFGNE